MAGAKNSLKISRKNIEKTQSSSTAVATAEAKHHPHVPHEIVHDILLRLPVKSLLRFKAVCKPWRSLISSGSQFVKPRKSNGGGRLICFETRPYNSPISRAFDLITPVSNLSCDGKAVKLEDVPYFLPISVSEYWGSCNGLFFIFTVIGPRCILWNPSTKEIKTNFSFFDLHNKKYIRGLSYNSSINKYKAIVAALHYNQKLHLYVSNSKFDHFKHIEYGDFPYYLPNHSNNAAAGVTVNGAPHWVMNKLIGSVRRVIIYFDSAVDRFKEVPLLPDSLGAKFEFISLVDLEGCLSAVVSHESHVDVWVMKESSWTQLFAIKHSSVTTIDNGYLKILGFMKGGDVVLMQINHEESLVGYNLKTGKKISVWSSGIKRECHCHIAMYQENLVSFSNLLT